MRTRNLPIAAVLTVAALTVASCGGNAVLRAPDSPRLVKSPAEPTLPTLGLPPPEVRSPSGLPRFALSERTLAIAVSVLPGQGQGVVSMLSTLMPTIAALAGDVSPAAGSLVGKLQAMPSAALTSATGSEMTYVLVENGVTRLVPIYALSGVQAEIKRAGSSANSEQVRIWGGLAQVAALGQVSQADTLLVVDMSLEPTNELTADPAVKAAFEARYREFRDQLRKAAAQAQQDVQTYADAYRSAQSAYFRAGGRFDATKGGTETQAIATRQACLERLQLIESGANNLAGLLAALPESAEQRLNDLKKAQSDGASGMVAFARVSLVDVKTSQLLYLAHIKLAAATASEAATQLGAFVAEGITGARGSAMGAVETP